MRWLMNGANHGTVDTCGENVSCFNEGKSKQIGHRLIIDNNSKVLRKEFGQQIPIKSRQKMNRDVDKFVEKTFGEEHSIGLSRHGCWKWQHFDYIEPNTRNGFFDSCVVQKFYTRDLCPSMLTLYRNDDNTIMEDVYGNLNGYESQCASVSGELMTFCIGGPRYFQNNTLLENSPLWTCLNPANDIHDTDIFRDTKYTYGSPLFRQHYEYPTNPSLNGVDNDEAWWDIDNRENDCFRMQMILAM